MTTCPSSRVRVCSLGRVSGSEHRGCLWDGWWVGGWLAGRGRSSNSDRLEFVTCVVLGQGGEGGFPSCTARGTITVPNQEVCHRVRIRIGLE